MSQYEITPLGYETLELRKEAGAHYTPTILSNFVASKIVAQVDKSHSDIFRILDPAVGDGELVISLLRMLADIYPADLIEVYGFDTDINALNVASDRIKAEFPGISIFFNNEDFLEHALNCGRNDLFSQNTIKYDVVIANPPYVRTQVMGSKTSRRIAQVFQLSGRVDLYHAFLLGISMVLKPGGLVGIITSNRFMTTKSGASVRSAILDQYQVLHVWDLGDTQLFEAAVLPSVMLLKRGNANSDVINCSPQFTSIYSTSSEQFDFDASNVIEALKFSGIVRTMDTGQVFEVKNGTLDHGQKKDGVWRISNKHSDNFLSKVKTRTYCTFGDVGKIRVGIKTTADKVFIRSNWAELPLDEQPEVLFPLITHHVARRFRMTELNKPVFVLYPHVVVNGKRTVIDLQKYPRTANYLESNRHILESRKYVIEAGRQWFEIWVPQDPGAWEFPKMVFRDISEKPTFWIDLDGGIVNGDCYWLTCQNPDDLDLLWLALAIGNSSFIEWFYDHSFNNKLYSGRRRFMTQYVEKFPIPQPDTDIGREIINLSKIAYEKASDQNELMDLTNRLDSLIWTAFDLSVEEVSG